MQDQANTQYVYCKIIEFIESTPLSLQIDFGDSGHDSDSRLNDEMMKKVAKYRSVVDALNYMSEKGWELVQVYKHQRGGSYSLQYLFKRKK